MQHHVKFKPIVHIYYDEDNGQFTLVTDWSDSCDGEYEEDDDGDEVACGYGEASDQAWVWLQDLMQHYPVLKNYPEPIQHAHQVNPAETPTGNMDWTTATLTTPTGPAFLKAKLLMQTAFDTCQHYIPPEKQLAEGYLVPEDHEWPYNTYLPYGACTNKKIVGPGGIGPCQLPSAAMPKCNGYEREEPVTLGEHTKTATTAPVTVTITRRRVGLGQPEWSIKDGENEPEVVKGESIAEAHANAIGRYHALTGKLPVNPAKEPKQGKPFIADLVGANAE